MGVLNVTPDSFHDGGKHDRLELAVAHARQLAADGADILDIGGESTRPGSHSVSVTEELGRVVPVVEALAGWYPLPISIDTTKPEVAEACLKRGATIINDVTAASDPAMLDLLRRYNPAVVLMHMRGTPLTMQQNCDYDDVVAEVKAYLRQRASQLAGVDTIIYDPGIGFGKTIAQNYAILSRLEEFEELGPVLVGPSRKSFLGGDVADRLPGTIAALTVAAMRGAAIVRVHDVKECRRALEVVEAAR